MAGESTGGLTGGPHDGLTGEPARGATGGATTDPHGDMGLGDIVLGPTEYGKSEIRLVHITRDTPRHEIRDLTVTTTLRGRYTDSYVTGDQTGQLPTDSQKNTVFSFARRYGIGAIEDFAARLARHFVDDIDLNTGARVQIDEHAWDRIDVDGAPHDHSFVRSGGGIRTATVTIDGSAHGGADGGVDGGGPGRRTVVSAGIRDLVVLKSTGSEYRGYVKDPYTTLAETTDRVLATSLDATWRYVAADGIDWDETSGQIRAILLSTFATRYSKALQHSLWHMGRDVLAACPSVAAIHLAAPNKHHFLVDLEPFGQDNPGEVFYASDRPYGMIEATVQRAGASPDLGWPQS